MGSLRNSNFTVSDNNSSFEENKDLNLDSSDHDDICDSHENSEENQPNLQKISLGLMLLSMRAQCQVTNDIVLNVIKSLNAVVHRYVFDTLWTWKKF